MYALSGNCHFCPAAPIRRAPAGILGLLHNSCGPNSDKTTSKKCFGSLVLGTLAQDPKSPVQPPSLVQLYSYFCSFRGDVSIMIYIYVSFVVIGDEYKMFQELHVMYRIYRPILKFYQMLRVVPRHNPIREIYHNPIRNSYRMIRTIPSVIPAYPTSVQTSTCKPGSAPAFPYPSI